MILLNSKRISIQAEDNGGLTIRDSKGACIHSDQGFRPFVQKPDGEKDYFTDRIVETSKYTTGLGEGVRWQVRSEGAEECDFYLEAFLEDFSGEILFSIIPVKDVAMEAIYWPAPFMFEEGMKASYSVLPMMQGILLPDDWPEEVRNVEPPCFLERNGYMPWLGQVRKGDGHGWMAIAETPWDAGYELTHPAGGPTGLHFLWQESMGRISYPRHLRLKLFGQCNYVTFCKEYRTYLRERGGARTLNEKINRYPKIGELIGTPVIHTCIKSDMKEEASCYDHLHPEKNYEFTTFSRRREQLEALHRRGVERAYVHLDGWGKSGYDREHPDVWPPCPEAGGMEGLGRLSESCKDMGYLLALHDQYRDYYTDAATYDADNSVMNVSGKRPGECTWNGGQQTYLCASQAYDYVRRNFQKADEGGIRIDGAYLDVFSVMRLDECLDPMHPMTRRECSQYRNECFSFIAERYGIVSSEEPLSSTVDYLALCHHAPYPTMPTLARGKGRGIPVPLFNLVYHDCIFTPWNMLEGEDSVMPDGRSGFLYALLNGGLCYLPIEPTEDDLMKTEEVNRLNRLVALEEMVNHEFVEGNPDRQRTTFANGVTVEVDFGKNTWSIA